MTKIPCENCGKETIEIKEIPPSKTYRRGFTGRKGYVFHEGRVVYLTKVCPNCGYKVGEKKIDHKKVIERMKRQGLPTVIEM